MKLIDLSEHPRFLAWQSEPMEGGDRTVKAPYRATGNLGHASVNDPGHRGTLAQATAQAARLAKPLGLGGVGVVLGPLEGVTVDGHNGWSLIGIDLDTCRSSVDGTVAAFAQAIIDKFGSYTEVSPSGTGFHVLLLAQHEDLDRLPSQRIWKKGGGDHPPAVETYHDKRYIALNPANLQDEIRTVSLDDLLWLVNDHAPAWVAQGEGAGSGGRARDGSRSADAVRLAIRLLRAGKVYEDFPVALREDHGLADWYHEKGMKNDHRETKRAWDAAVRAMATQGAEFEELNREFAVITVKGKAVVLWEHPDVAGRPTFSLMTRDSFKLWLSGRNVMVGVKAVPIADLWLGWSGHRTYVGLTFKPSGAPPGYYNLWRGWAVTPGTQGSCKLFKQHLLENVCDGDRAKYLWLFGWFADLFQNPEKKPGTAVVLRGNQGVGKSIVGAAFGKLLGSHYVQTGSGRFVTGQFNAHLASALLLHCDEAFWAGDKRAESVLKDLITGTQQMIEQKGIDAYVMDNLTRAFITGDQDWLIPAAMQERRFGVFDVLDTHMQDRSYFKAILAELEAGGYERLLYELLNFDLSQVSLGVIPVNDALFDQKVASFTPEQSWYFDLLKHGKLPFGCEDPRSCPVEVLFDHYIMHARKQGAGRRSAQVRWGMFLHKLVGEGFQRYRENYRINQISDPIRGYVYTFPSLSECRVRFAAHLQQKITWHDDPDRDWEKILPPPQLVTSF
jgi:hypothetical protein